MTSWPPPGGDTPPPPGPPGPQTRWARPAWLTTFAVLLACYATGFAVNNLAGTRFAGVLDRVFPHVGQSDRLDTGSIASAWDTIQREYVRRGVSGSTGTQGAERGLIESLRSSFGDDRFSNFLTSDEYAQLQRDLGGQRSGSIGIALEARCAGATICASGQTATVVAIEEVLHGQPAEKAGLHNGDVLVKVNGTDVAGLGSDVSTRIDKAGPLIRGTPGTPVTLTVDRAGRSLDLTITRADLNIPSVYRQRFGTVLYIEVTGFDNGTGDAVKTALREQLAAGATSVVLDLRHNPGGLVSEAQATASQFLTPGPNQQDVVVRRGRLDTQGDPNSAQRVDRDPILEGGVARTVPVVVLVDGDSASAAEIVTAALKDYHRATIVGEKTFGKGSVQEDFPLPDGSDLHLTVEKWFGPAGESIDNTGITPDRTVAVSDDDHRFRLDAEGPDAAQDAQLQAALSVARGG